MSTHPHPRRFSRREALGVLGASAAAFALPEFASAAPPTFPKGAVIRTVLKDYAPEDLAGGATLFHEHLSLAPDFMPRWMASARATREASGQAAAPGRQGGAAPAAQAEPEGAFFMQDVDLRPGNELALGYLNTNQGDLHQMLGTFNGNSNLYYLVNYVATVGAYASVQGKV